jgi:protein involved in polysaccharide export with SLBB domain
MLSRLLLVALSQCALCAGQSVLTTPADAMQSTPSVSSTESGAAGSSDSKVPSTARQQKPSATELGSEQKGDRIVPSSPATIGPLAIQSEFQQFAEDAAGRPLQVYGRKLFDEVPSTFAPMDRIPVPANYVLGPGDELLIRAWGKVELEARVTIDRNGQISLPKVGTLNVAGLRYDQLEGFLRNAVSKLFKDFELNVTLGQLRSIQIFVLGSARQPGAYTVSSLSTLVNALFASGGPSATGTMRYIELRRDNRVLTEFDIYDLLRSGDKSHDVQLLPGDVIYIPPAGPQIAIIGSVNEPGIYELKRGDIAIAAALKDAGGLTSLAAIDRVLLERIENRRRRRVDEFALDASGLQRTVSDGDLLRIFPISPEFENAVTLRGNVARPGRYAWHDGMRVSDLIPTRDSLITRKYWNQQNNLIPPEGDHQFESPALGPTRNQRIDQSGNQRTDKFANQRTDQSGYQREDQSGYQHEDQSGYQHEDQSADQREDQPGNRRTDRSAALGAVTIDAIGQNNAEINWEYAVIERLDEKDLSTHLIPFRLASAVDNPASPDNQALKAEDVVTIFSRADLELPIEKHASFVQVGGEVNAPGVYRVKPGETLRDVVRQSGGLTPHSYLYASRLSRASTRRAEEEQLRQSSEQLQSELISKYANATPPAGQTATDQQAQLGLQQAAIARLSLIKPTGRIVLNMKPDAADIGDIPELPIEDGDTFYVPPRLSTVQVAGSVYNANAFRYQPRRQLYAYLDDAGGPTREADRKRIFVIRADGTVISRQSRNNHMHGDFAKLRLLPGDAIVVPEKLKAPGNLGIQDFAQIVSSSALTAAALATVVK